MNAQLPTQPFRLRLLSVARRYADAHVHEEGGNNRGAMVEHFQRANGGQAGEPWCADFVSTCGMESRLKAEGIDNPAGLHYIAARRWVSQNFFLCSPSVELIQEDAQRRGVWRLATWNPKPGDLVLFRFKTGNHIGVVVQHDGDTLHTVEGNTSDGDDRDGGGVAYRTRTLANVWGFIDMGNS